MSAMECRQAAAGGCGQVGQCYEWLCYGVQVDGGVLSTGTLQRAVRWGSATEYGSLGSIAGFGGKSGGSNLRK